MAPLLLIAAGLIVVFRANIWNLGIDGQFLLGAAVAVGIAPELVAALPNGLALLLLWLIAGVVGAAWTIVPAFLKAWYNVNEIITTLMMSFIGINVANLLVKGPFRDFETTNVPQTRSFRSRTGCRVYPERPSTSASSSRSSRSSPSTT